jgi:hypothetical protein
MLNLTGGWLSKYLAVCSTTDKCRALDAMQALANKVEAFAPQQINQAGKYLHYIKKIIYFFYYCYYVYEYEYN